MELCAFGHEIKISMDTLIAFVALIISVISLGLSRHSWRRSFRPIVTAAVKTHSAGNEAITYNLVLLNSGTIPAKNVVVRPDNVSLSSAFGSDATSENKKRWLACFAEEAQIPILHNGDHISCSFGMTTGNDTGFWKYKSKISVVIEYVGWFGIEYKQPQELRIVDSDSFTGFMWTNSGA